MDFIVLIYSVAGLVVIAVSMPSVIQLIETKRSDELSLFSWVGWLVYQSIAVTYATHLNAMSLMFINSLWFTLL